MQNAIPKRSRRERDPAGAQSGVPLGVRSGVRVRSAVDRPLERRRAAYEDEVGRLVEAAFALIRETGNLEPRVSEIVERSGLSNQAFYRHFRSKHELLVAVLDEGAHLLASYLHHRMDAAPSPLEAVRAWIGGILEQALNPEAAAATRPFALTRSRLAELCPAEVAESERQLTGLAAEAIAACVRDGVIPETAAERDAETLYHIALGWMQARLSEESPASRADAERVIDFALTGMLRGRAAPNPRRGRAAKSPAAPREGAATHRKPRGRAATNPQPRGRAAPDPKA